LIELDILKYIVDIFEPLGPKRLVKYILETFEIFLDIMEPDDDSENKIKI
jgi:hypothetical protein